jgi:hypothetical protein
MSPKTKKFSDLAAPLYADPERRERIETQKRRCSPESVWRRCALSKV